MKKNSMLLAAAMTFSTVAAMANPFSDVPASHWAFDAVNKLTSNGVLQGYPDGTFKGEKNVTRYHLAMVVAKMLSNVEQMMGNGTGTNFVTKADLQTLEKLTVEFADELALLGVKVTALEDDMQVVKEDVAGVKKDVEAIKSHMANGGLEKVAITGDMLVRHDDSLKFKTIGGETSGRGSNTYSSFRLNFDAKIDENIEARVRTVSYADNYGDDLGGAAGHGSASSLWHYSGKNDKIQNDVDIATLKIKNTLFNGDLTIGRDYISHGSALVMNDYFDGIGFAKKMGAVDFELNMFYGNEWEDGKGRNDKDLWNLNLGYEVKGHKLHLGFYTQDYVGGEDIYDENGDYVDTVYDNNDKAQVIEFAAEGELGNNGNFSYKAAFISEKVDNGMFENGEVKDTDGNAYHVELKYDTKDAFAIKLAYTGFNDEYQDFLMGDRNRGYHRAYDDEVKSPIEDIAYFYNDFRGYNMMNDANNLKIEFGYKPVNSKHSARLAYDMYTKKDAGINQDANLEDAEVKVLTLEYRYQLAENTAITLGYASADGDKIAKEVKDDRFFVELYSKF
jgi:hypothetical protein